jgi:hypothetical protein
MAINPGDLKEDPIPGSGVIDTAEGNAYKKVLVNVQQYGDRPTARAQRYPNPGSREGAIEGHLRLGGYTVAYDWPEGGEAKIVITP